MKLDKLDICFEEIEDIEDKLWIVIVFKDGDIAYYQPDEYTDYLYDKKSFIVINDKQWIGIYNWETVKYVELLEKED